MQGGAATEQTDNLAMNLRQAERELVIRDEETRRLRSALVHLEHTLSQREREFHDAVRQRAFLVPYTRLFVEDIVLVACDEFTRDIFWFDSQVTFGLVPFC